MRVNENYTNLPNNYLFADIARKVQAFKAGNSDADVISLGIGDVTQPLCPAVVEALHKATDEMATAATFRGYGPEQGYDFLRNAIVENDFHARGIDIDADEVFVSDGAKSDTGNFQELLSPHCVIAVTDPVYPVYVDSNIMAGRRIVKLPCTSENQFIPELPREHVDAIYLCYPNNPTGTVLTIEQLNEWVDYALATDTLIFYDAAYEAYIHSQDVPHSIYQIPGAKHCAVEFHSFSKTAGFTGIRCGYTIVPKTLHIPLNQMWSRRQCTKFNGTSYISQRAAEAIYTPQGKQQIRATINYYMHNAQVMRKSLTDMDLKVYGGTDAPYLWVSTPTGTSSWEFFDLLLNCAHVVCTPGSGFGPSGEGFVRLTAFGTHESTEEALCRIANRL